MITGRNGRARCSRHLAIYVCVLWPFEAHSTEETTTVTGNSAWSIGFDADWRARFESSQNPVFGLSETQSDDYLLHRLQLGAEIGNDRGFRAAGQLVSGLTAGWTGSPPAVQDDPIDVLQGFVEQSFSAFDGPLTLRAGRQAMSFGSSRLVSVRESPNVRRSFDGMRASWNGPAGTQADLFAVRPVLPEGGTWDDSSSQDQSFWGLYVTSEVSAGAGLHADVYYLGLRRKDAEFAQGIATEVRHSIGARLFGDHEGVDWNIEAVWQWGTFGDDDIRAWTLSADVGYELTGFPLTPRLGLKIDAISGDRNLQDKRLETFNPLFPKLPYFSEANVATPANLLDFQPSITFVVSQTAVISLSWNALWKHAKEDAFYAPPLSPVAGTASTDGRAIGHQASLNLEWQLTRQLEIGAAYVDFEPRNVAQSAGGRSGRFFALWVQLHLPN